MAAQDHEGLVSVLMVVRNESARIDDAMGSVLGQSYPDLELIVIDGCSDDDTSRKVMRAAERDRRVRLVANPQRVIPTGLNHGLNAARGEFVARLDGHSRWNADYLADGVSRLRARPDLAGVGGRRYGVATTHSGAVIAAALSSQFGVGNSIYHYGTKAQETDHTTSAVYRTAAARGIGGWDESLLVNEDVDFDFRLRKMGHGLLYDPGMTTAWHVRESLPELLHQYRRYGRGKAAMVHKNGLPALRLRHLASPALVVSLAVTLTGALLGRRRPAIGLLGLYGSAVVAGSALTMQRSGLGRDDIPRLAGAFSAMHLGWGLGFLEGMAIRSAPAAASASERADADVTGPERTPPR